MKDIQEHVVIKDQELTYTELPLYTTQKDRVLGQEAKVSEGKELTLHFDRKQLIISKENKELATVSYQAINQESLRDKKLHSSYLMIGPQKIDSSSVSFLVIFILSTVNYLILISIFLPTWHENLDSFTTNFQDRFNCILNCLGLLFLLCPHQLTIPSSIYYDDHD